MYTEIFKRTSKKGGNPTYNVRLRLVDGRNTTLYHKLGMTATEDELSKFQKNGELKKRVTLYNKELHDTITQHMNAMEAVYRTCTNNGTVLDSKLFERLIDEHLHPEKYKDQPEQPMSIYDKMLEYIERSYKAGDFGLDRYKHYIVLTKEMRRFLVIKGNIDMPANDFGVDVLTDFHSFLLNEYKYVDKYPQLYIDTRDTNIPKQRRSTNTVAVRMKALRAIFAQMEAEDEMDKSPFHKLGKTRKKTIMKEEYDTPVSLTAEEFNQVRNTDVPQSLQAVKDLFVFNCLCGARVGDFSRLGWRNVAVDNDGFAYIHYLPTKTAHTTKNHEEIETPLMLSALEIIKRYDFNFPLLKYPRGKSGYNNKITELLKYCGINREVKVFNTETQTNDYVPLSEKASSKMARKVFVNLTAKFQINAYMSGLHKQGSGAVKNYLDVTLADRFVVMCEAFGEMPYRVDQKLNVIKD